MALRRRLRKLDPTDPALSGLTVARMAQQPTGRPRRKNAISVVDRRSVVRSQPSLFHCGLPVDNDRRITNKVSELQYFLGETMHSLADDIGAVTCHVAAARRAGRECREGCIRLRGPRRFRCLFGQRSHHCCAASDGAQDHLSSLLAGGNKQRASRLEERHRRSRLLIRYTEPFWRRRGLSGSVIWRDPHGLYACDTSHDDQHPALVVFVGGPHRASSGQARR